jgi:hypothetical protein
MYGMAGACCEDAIVWVGHRHHQDALTDARACYPGVGEASWSNLGDACLPVARPTADLFKPGTTTRAAKGR